MNIFYLRYYISKTISKAIGSFSSIDKEIKHCICKDQFRFRSNTGMDPGPRSPNNEFVECGKKS